MENIFRLSKLSMFVVGLASICAHTTMALPNTDSKPTKDEHSFDYVVVGGGTAGLTLASRLVEESHSTVAVIEAGGYYEKDNGNISTVPAFWTFSVGTDPDDVNPAVDWGFVTQPEKVRSSHSLLSNIDTPREYSTANSITHVARHLVDRQPAMS